jgi:hypothetical protein
MDIERKRRIAKRVAFILPAFLILFAGMIWAVFALWNWLMPAIFGLHAITYWQALGLMALSWILFRGFRGPRFAGSHWRNGMRGRWQGMTPAQREEFVKAAKDLRSRWNGTTMPEPEPKG